MRASRGAGLQKTARQRRCRPGAKTGTLQHCPASGFCGNIAAVQNEPPETMNIHSEAFLHTLMRRQLKLSIACAATFLVALLGLPLANYYFPEAMATRVGGFTLTWLILGVLFFPFVWIIAFAFIKKSIALEEAEAAEVKKTVSESVGK